MSALRAALSAMRDFEWLTIAMVACFVLSAFFLALSVVLFATLP